MNITIHGIVKIKIVDVKSSIYLDFNVENKDPKFEVGDHAKLSKDTKIPWTYVLEDLNGEKLLERFMEKNCEIQIKKSLE